LQTASLIRRAICAAAPAAGLAGVSHAEDAAYSTKPVTIIVPFRVALGQTVIKRLSELGGEPAPMSPAQFKAFIQGKSARLAKLVEDAEITPDH
jgi:tripartite-type tricarboxylate transporter receptor subunit TctC